MPPSCSSDGEGIRTSQVDDQYNPLSARVVESTVDLRVVEANHLPPSMGLDATVHPCSAKAIILVAVWDNEGDVNT